MNSLILYRNGAEHLDLNQRGKRGVTSATLTRSLLSEDTFSIKIATREVLDIQINDYLIHEGAIYRLDSLPSITRTADDQLEYSIDARGAMYDLARVQFLNADATGFYTDMTFPLIGSLSVFLEAIRSNMIRLIPNFQVISIDGGDSKTLSFSEDTCLSAMQKICNEFKTDFWVDTENGIPTLRTGEFGQTTPLNLAYGRGKGLYRLTRKKVDDSRIINRLYVYGGDKNLPENYKAKALHLPGSPYLEDADSIARLGLREGVIKFDDIYPKRTGVVSSVRGVHLFVDDTLDFDLEERDQDGSTKYLIPGTKAKIHFQTGGLAGYQFEIQKTIKNKIRIIPFQNDTGQKFPDPNSEAFQIKEGDTYVLLDVRMPQSYIDKAEKELLEKGEKEFLQKKQAKVAYDLDLDPIFLKDKTLGIGDLIQIVDEELNVDKVLRIQSTTTTLVENGAPQQQTKITIADSYQIAISSQLVLQVQELRNIQSLTQGTDFNFSKIGYNATRELKEKIFDPDGYLDATNIKPLSIQTGMLSVGASAQDFNFTSILTPEVDRLSWTQGQMHSPTLSKIWTILEGEIPTDEDWKYIYLKASKQEDGATFILTQTQIKLDQDPNDFYFYLGILHRVQQGVRLISATHGNTTINGGLIRTGRISSGDGRTEFNLDTGEIKGRIQFAPGSTGYANLADAPDLTPVQNEIKRLNDVTNWMHPTVSPELNAILAGTIAVGNGAHGLTGILSGKTDKGDESLRLGLGKNKTGYNFEHLDDGMMLFRHKNGKIGFEIGIKNGRLTLNGYHENGGKVFELSPSRGLVAVTVIPESYIAFEVHRFIRLTEPNATLDVLESEVQRQIHSFRDSDYSRPHIDGTTTFSLHLRVNMTLYEYSTGTSPYTQEFKEKEGWKTAENRDRNAPDGWYSMRTGEIGKTTKKEHLDLEIIFLEEGKIKRKETVKIK